MSPMNFNNWLSYPLSPTHVSLPTNLDEASQSHHFALGLYNEPMETLQDQEWISNNSVSQQDVLKAEDFLGVGDPETPSDVSSFGHFQATPSDYPFLPNCTLGGLESTTVVDATVAQVDNIENPQSLALTMGNDNNSSNAESSSTTSNAIVLAPRRTLDTFGQRTSIYRGVTKHRWTGRYEAHLWDNTSRREGQSRKGRQVYLGGYDKEEKAARAYDLAALKYWGTSTTTNFPLSTYEREVEEMKHMTRQEFIASLRRRSSGFSRGASMYRGVTRHHQHGRWQARIGRVSGNKDLYLGTFSTEEEAAEAYDVAAIKFRGLSAVTNFDMNRYNVKSILESNLPFGNSKRFKESHAIELARKREDMQVLVAANFYDGSSSSTSFQGYPSLTQIDHHSQPTPLLTLQNHSNPYYFQSSITNPTFFPLNSHLQQQQTTMDLFQPAQDSVQYNQVYGLHNHPSHLHGYMSMNSSMIGSNEVTMAATSSTSGTAGVPDDSVTNYDASSVCYGGWSVDSVNGATNSGVYPMWGNDH